MKTEDGNDFVITDHNLRAIGHQVTTGAIGKLYDSTRFLRVFLLLVFIIFAAFNIARWQFGWGMDDTDVSSWERSGLRVHTDALTGIQYLSDGKGGLIRREGLDED